MVPVRTITLFGSLAAMVGLYFYQQSRAGGAFIAQVTGGLVTASGETNNNPGNIRFIAPEHAYNGQIGEHNGFGVYDSPANGVRAWSKTVQKYGVSTVAGIVRIYAPPSENDTDAYAMNVASELGVDPNEEFDLYGSLPQLAAAMFKQEIGRNPYSAEQLTQWVYA